MSSGGPISGGGGRRSSSAGSARATRAAIDAAPSRMPERRKPIATIRRWRIIDAASCNAPADDAEHGHHGAEPTDDTGHGADRLNHRDGIVGAAGRKPHAGEKRDRQHDHDGAN